jgi:uncharacterized protein (TIGR03435 family)
MEAFAPIIRGISGGYLDHPVMDSTGLKGSWNFDLKWSPRGALATSGSDGISIFDAVDRQLGLKLEAQKVPTPVIVVDTVNETPTGNPPGVTQALPPRPPAEFEVADIKPSAPGTDPRGGGNFMPGGRIDLKAFPLRAMITIAWEIGPGEELVGAPKWLHDDSPLFDLIAKAATTVTTPADGPPVDFKDLEIMLRGLLADRFKLATHYEDRPMTAYTLVAAKPKLKKADFSNRTGCKTGPAPVTREPRAMGTPLRLSRCQNMTMAQFAEQLQNIAPAYFYYPVLDATGLDGAWDFSFTFSVSPRQAGGGRDGGGVGSTSSGAPAASDPVGTPTEN